MAEQIPHRLIKIEDRAGGPRRLTCWVVQVHLSHRIDGPYETGSFTVAAEDLPAAVALARSVAESGISEELSWEIQGVAGQGAVWLERSDADLLSRTDQLTHRAEAP